MDLLNDVWNSFVNDVLYVSSRTILVKFKFARVKVCAVDMYAHTKDDEETEKFWNNLDRVGNG